jgi:hypothetical protein
VNQIHQLVNNPNFSIHVIPREWKLQKHEEWAPGFESLDLSGIALGVGNTETHNAQLTAGQVSANVVVTAEAGATLNTTDASIGNEKSSSSTSAKTRRTSRGFTRMNADQKNYFIFF